MDAVRQLSRALFRDASCDDRRANEAVEKIGLWAYGEADLGWKAAEPLIAHFRETDGWSADKTASYSALDLVAMLPTHSEWRGPANVDNVQVLSPPVIDSLNGGGASGNNKTKAEETAIAYFLIEAKKRPACEITKAEICREFNFAKSTLSRKRAPTLNAVMAAHQSQSSAGTVRRGSKNADGHIEAID